MPGPTTDLKPVTDLGFGVIDLGFFQDDNLGFCPLCKLKKKSSKVNYMGFIGIPLALKLHRDTTILCRQANYMCFGFRGSEPETTKDILNLEDSTKIGDGLFRLWLFRFNQN